MTNEVLKSVVDTLPAIADRAVEVDVARHVPGASIQALSEAGVFAMLQPRRYGGLECPPTQFYEVTRAISAACGSTGWVASVLGIHPWQLGLFAERAQDDVWGTNPATLLSSSYAPVGRLVPVQDGFELSGQWRFSSGCEHADWALLGALEVGAKGNPVDFLTVLVPRTDYVINDVWDATGLRGTASNDIVVEQVFVPDYRVLRNSDLGRLRGPGQAVNTGPLYRLPFGALFTSAITAPLLGIAGGCYDAYVRIMRERIRGSLGGGHFAEDPFAQVAVARAASEIDAAVLQMDRNIGALWNSAEAGEDIPFELRLRTRRDQVRGTERALAAVDLLFKTGGANSLQRGNPIERAWRDAHAGSVHVANDIERTLMQYGRGALGVKVDEALL